MSRAIQQGTKFAPCFAHIIVTSLHIIVPMQNEEPSRGLFALDGELELARSVRVRLLADAVRVFAPPHATTLASDPSTLVPTPLTQA